MYNRYQIMVLSICMVIASTGFIGAFSTPVANTIIVSFDQTEAETAAIDILHEEIPNAITVPFGGLQYNLLKMRAIGPMVFVGHGNDQGIQNGRTLVSSERLSAEIDTCVSSKIILLACNSEGIASLGESKRTFGFSSMVDAELAALETVIRINVFQRHIDAVYSIFEQFLSIAEKKISGETSILPLFLVIDPGDGGGTTPPAPQPYFSSTELWNSIRIFVSGCVWALIGFGVSAAMDKLASSIASKVCYYTVGATQTTKMQLLFNFVKTYGISMMGQAVKNVYGGYGNMVSAWLDMTVDVLDDWTSSMSVGEWAIFIGVCALEILIIILTAGSEAYVRCLAGIGIAAITAGTIAISDALDPDGDPSKTISQAISSLLD